VIPQLRELPVAERTIPGMLQYRAGLGAKPFVSAPGGTRTYADAPAIAARSAGALAEAGIVPGDRVACMASNRIEFLDVWFGCAWLGAILVPVNVDLRAGQLSHVLSDSGARLLVVEASRLEQVREAVTSESALERIWVIPDDPIHTPVGIEEPFPPPGAGINPTPVNPGSICAILYTSGTTGAPKGVCCPHGQSYWWGVNVAELLRLTDTDVLYTCLPLFHTNALNAPFHALATGASIVAGETFSASRFWHRVVDSRATITYLLGVMVQILADKEPTTADTAHSVRRALAPGTPAALAIPFRERFGVTLVDAYGSTETNAVIGATDDAPAGTMGKVIRGFEARVVDEHDNDVPDGEPGELVLRPLETHSFASGYYRNAETTVEAWRNLWHHTGDQVARDREGWFTFKQRLNDRIRRRGENVSAWEVEQALEQHPDVGLAAVIGVPSEFGEDEVMAFVVAHDGRTVEPESLLAHCRERLAKFAVPRYLEIVDTLPLTTTGKVEKYRLRALLDSSTRPSPGVAPLAGQGPES
jgi:crotonobetaine/carnitine-CoA ligase